MTTSPSPLLEADERAWHYWFSDGLTNVVAGIGCLLIAFCVLYPPHLPLKPLQMAAWGLALWLYAIVILRHRHVVEWLKSKITYPRTGYAQTPADAICPFPFTKLSLRESASTDVLGQLRLQRRRKTLLMLGLMVISALVEVIALRQRWVWLAAGLIASAAIFMARKQFNISWIMPIGFALLGACMTIFHPSLKIAPGIFVVGWGAIYMVDGTFTLIRYLWLNPEPKAPAA